MDINIIYILKGKGFTIYIIIVITLRWWIQLFQWHEDDELIEISFIGLEGWLGDIDIDMDKQ